MKLQAPTYAQRLENRPRVAPTRPEAPKRKPVAREDSGVVERRPVAWWSGQLKALILPPTGLIWPGIVGLILLRTPWEDVGFLLLVTTFLSQVLLGLPAVQYRLLAWLDRYPPIDPAAVLPENAAIVVLDAGRRIAAREYGGDTVKPMTLERLRYSAWLHHKTGLPILTSGNGAGKLMGQVSHDSFSAPVRWRETSSRNTLESARRAARLLRQEGIRTIYLVTHFWHMPRAVAAFKEAGLDVRPAPMGFQDPEGIERGWGALIPRLTALEGSYWAIHEMIGLGWYRWRHGRKLDR